jgi:hypothetical protein
MKKSATKVVRRIRYLLSCLAGRSNFRTRRPQRHRFVRSGPQGPTGSGRAQLAWVPVRSDGQVNRPMGSP